MTLVWKVIIYRNETFFARVKRQNYYKLLILTKSILYYISLMIGK